MSNQRTAKSSSTTTTKTTKSSQSGDYDSTNKVTPASTRAKHDKQTSKLRKLIGQLFLLILVISLIFSGLVINIVQVIILISSKLRRHDKSWQALHKKLLAKTVKILHSQIVFMTHIWDQLELKVVFADAKLLESLKGQITTVFVLNHTYQLDWVASYILTDHLGFQGCFKCFAKDELKYVPVIGWSAWMVDFLFVKRNWEQDKKNFSTRMNELLMYEQPTVGLFAEGTRFTENKYKESVEFAHSKSLQPFKYHLYPRSRGFVHTVRHFLIGDNLSDVHTNKELKILNVQIAMPTDEAPYTFASFIEGKKLKTHFYIEEVELSNDIATEIRESKDGDSCPKLSQLLYDIYRRKDELMDNYKRNVNKFSQPKEGACVTFTHPIESYIYAIACLSFTYGTLLYWAMVVFKHSLIFWTLSATLLACGLWMVRMIDIKMKPTDAPKSKSR